MTCSKIKFYFVKFYIFACHDDPILGLIHHYHNDHIYCNNLMYIYLLSVHATLKGITACLDTVYFHLSLVTRIASSCRRHLHDS